MQAPHARCTSGSPRDGALTWATSERPNVLLFVISNFLSNPAKASLGAYEKENRPFFRIKRLGAQRP